MSDQRLLRHRRPRAAASTRRTRSPAARVYTDDLTRPGMLHGALLQSPLAHARILNIDTSQAERLPGVKAVLTAANAPDVRFGVSPARYDETVFCQDKVRYIGDEIAAVAAVDRETALEALELIEVDYEELDAGARRAHAPWTEGAPQLHELYPGNICAQVEQDFGDVEAARARAHVVRTGSLSNKMQNGAFLEPQCALAELDLHGPADALDLHPGAPLRGRAPWPWCWACPSTRCGW